MDKSIYNKPWIMERADPYVIKVDGWYYFTASMPKYDCICIRKAKRIEDLKDAKEHVIWEKHESGPMSEHIWAPELHFIDGKWYVYFAAGEKDNIWKIRPYVLECSDTDPAIGKWEEKGKMQAADGDEFSFRAFSLDATVFSNKGENYFVWAEKVGVGKQISNLYIARMKSPTKLDTVQVMLSTPDYDWERHGFWVNEGPAVIKHENKIYLTYSASETGEKYCMGMLTANIDSDLLDPNVWEKERNPVLKSNSNLCIYGPGHNSFTEDLNGNPVMVYHARNTDKIEGNPLYVPNRHAMLMPIKWNTDGKPVFIFDD